MRREMERIFYNSASRIRYNVRLDLFEGPIDLLLHLIRKNRVDIYDIPIASITEQYLEYIKVMKELNLDLAGEYLLMAATLIHIKSKMLVPLENVDDESPGDEPEDPRAELVRKLLDYQRYKEVSAYFSECDMMSRDVFPSGSNEVAHLKSEFESTGIIDVSLFHLIEALQSVIKKSKEKIIHEVTAERLSIRDKLAELTERLKNDSMFLFTALFEETATKPVIIITFLALLELMKLKMAKVVQTERFGPIRVVSLLS